MTVRGTLLAVAVLAALWEGLHRIVGSIALPSPVATAQHLWTLFRTDWFWPHVLATGEAVAIALLISLVGGVAIGLLLGVFRFAGDVVEPLLTGFYALPKITLYPVVLLIFGLGPAAKIAFGVMHGFVPVALFTLGAVRNVRRIHLRASRAMRLTRAQTATRVLLPASFPEVLTGCRMSFALTLLGVLIGEMFAAQEGLGFLLRRGMTLADSETIFAVSLLLFVVAWLVAWSSGFLNRQPRPSTLTRHSLSSVTTSIG